MPASLAQNNCSWTNFFYSLALALVLGSDVIPQKGLFESRIVEEDAAVSE